VKRKDRDAMRRCIEIMRHESPESREQAGHFAAYAVQCDTLRLKPWEAPPCCVWGYDQSGGIELRERLVAAGLSIYEPDPVKALAEAEQQEAVR
jgi:hypothetical protein